MHSAHTAVYTHHACIYTVVCPYPNWCLSAPEQSHLRTLHMQKVASAGARVYDRGGGGGSRCHRPYVCILHIVGVIHPWWRVSKAFFHGLVNDIDGILYSTREGNDSMPKTRITSDTKAPSSEYEVAMWRLSSEPQAATAASGRAMQRRAATRGSNALVGGGEVSCCS
jgi:hypothetical protein